MVRINETVPSTEKVSLRMATNAKMSNTKKVGLAVSINAIVPGKKKFFIALFISSLTISNTPTILDAKTALLIID